MQEMTVIDWLKAYRANSPIYTGSAFSGLDTETLGSSVRLLCASIADQHDTYAVEHTIDLLTSSLAVMASNHGMSQFIIKTGPTGDGKSWSILVRHMDGNADGEAPTLETAKRRLEASLEKTAAVPAEALMAIWESAQATHPFLLRLTNEEIGTIADPVRRALVGRVAIEDLIGLTAGIVFIVLAFEYTKSINAVRYISNLEDGGRVLGDWALFLTEDGDFAKLVTELDTSLANKAG